MLGDKHAVNIVFDEIAPRFADRPGGYTRILKLAQTRLGDAGQKVILEFVGVHDRVATKSEKPAFDTDVEDENVAVAPAETGEQEAEAVEAESDSEPTEESETGTNTVAEASDQEGTDESAEPDTEK